MAGADAATAIILAGGRSSRFGSEKLSADLDGEPLLHHVVRIATSVCAEVLVVGAASGVPVPMPDDLPSAPTVLLDVDAFEGPLVALVRAARAASQARLLLLAGDMPYLLPSLADRLCTWKVVVDGTCLVSDGWPQPFPMGLDRETTVARGSELVEAGERSLRSLMSALALEQIPEDEWRVIDPDGRSLRDIDRPEDVLTTLRGDTDPSLGRPPRSP